MSPSLKKILKITIPIIIGLGLVLYSYFTTTPEDRQQIFDSIKNVDLTLVLLSILIGAVSHISRAIRWNYLLEPLGYKPKLINNIFIIFISYFANLLIIRSGEVLRVTALKTYENVPFEKGLGTVVTERIIDVIMLLLIILIALILQTDIIFQILEKNGIGLFGSIAILFAGVIGLYVAVRIIKKSKAPLAIKIKTFLTGLLDGVLSIFKMKRKGAFIFHTFLIWTCYIGMFWVIKYTVPETAVLSLGQILVAFVAGTFAMVATNGGLGLYPIAVAATLGFFGISENAGEAFGWIMWTSQNSMLLVFGAISFLLLPLFNRNR